MQRHVRMPLGGPLAISSSRRDRNRRRLMLETLDDRIAPAVFTVTNTNDSGTGSLRQAVLSAAPNGVSDIINFSSSLAGQTITLTSNDSVTAFGPTAIVFGADTLTIDGSAAPGLTISGNNTHRIFALMNTANVTLQSLTLTGGKAQGGSGGVDTTGVNNLSTNAGGAGAGMGGAIYSFGGTLQLVQSTLTGNTAQGGNGGNGGPAVSAYAAGGGGSVGGNGGNITIIGQNTAGGGAGVGGVGGAGVGGGGLGGQNQNGVQAVGGTPGTLGGGGGGAVSFPGAGGSGTAVSTISGFGGGGGGGIGNVGGAGGFGAGGGASTNSSVSAGVGGFGGGGGGARSTVAGGGFGGGNGGAAFGAGGGGGAGMGGAIFMNGGFVNITNSTLTANSAIGGAGGTNFNIGTNAAAGSGFGGALFARNASINILSSTFGSNPSTSNGRSVYLLGDGGNGSATIFNSILGVPDSSVIEFYGNAINGGSIGTNTNYNLIRSAVNLTGSYSSADPQLGMLANNGGPTMSMLPSATSPALNTGFNTPSGALATDQTGISSRFYGTVDMGAVERQPPYIFSSNVLSMTYGATASIPISSYGTPQPTFSVVSGSGNLPAGVTLSSAGVFSGSPTAFGGFSFTVLANNGVGVFSQNFQIIANPATTTTTLATSSSTTTYGQGGPVLTATVAVSAPSTATPTGQVHFYDATTSTYLGTEALSGGQAVLPIAGIAVGTHAIQAQFDINNTSPNFASSNSASVTQTVTKASTTVSLSGPGATSYGQNAGFTATINVTTPGGGTPTGTVTFLDGASPIGTVAASGGAATLMISTLGVAIHNITAVYNGSSNFSASAASNTVTQVVNSTATTVALGSSGSSTSYGQAVTFTANLAVTAPGGGVPAGTVTFHDGVTVLDTVTTSGGVASLTISNLDVASHTIQAEYISSSNSYLTSWSNPVSLQVNQSATTVALGSSGSTTKYGQAVTFTATISVTAPGGGTPTGTVTFFDGASAIGTIATSGGVASFTTSTLDVASHSITAVYNGTANYAASLASNSVTQTVNQAATTIGLVGPGAATAFGQNATFTATIAVTAPGGGSPTGTVTFTDGAAFSSTVPVSGSTAVLNTAALTVGGHNITATYNGDAGHSGSPASNSVSQTVNQAATTVALNGPGAAIAYGQNATFTATINVTAPGLPTGTVTFTDGATFSTTVPVSGSSAVLNTANLGVGSHSITATYNGDAGHSASPVSNAVSQAVSQAATTIGLVGSGSPSSYGQSLTFTATISVTAPGGGTPTGTVTFFDGVTALNTITTSGGVASLTMSTLGVASHNITAVYNGNASYAASPASSAVVQQVNQAATTIGLVGPGAATAYGQNASFTATIAVTAPGGGSPTGTVTFTDGAAFSATVPVSGNTAVLNSGALTVGSHNITATYNGDPGHSASPASNAVAQTVNQAATTVALNGAGTAIAFGQNATFTAAITVTAPGLPTGTVTFSDGATFSTTVPVSGSSAVLNTAGLAVGSHSITATYNGDAGHTASPASNSVSQSVSQAATTVGLVGSGSPSSYGQGVTFTATINVTAPGGGTPTGTVTFYEGASVLDTITASGGVAALVTSTLGVASHNITAVFNGNANYAASPASNTVAQQVNQAATTVVLGGSGGPTNYGQAVTFTATIGVTAPGGGTPTGTVTFFDGASAIGTITASGGVAALVTSTLGVASHNITAVYNGNANYAASPASNTAVQQVNQAATTISLAGAGTTTFGHVATLTASISVTAPGGGSPTGTVTFFDGATPIGSIPVVSGMAVLNTATLLPASHSIAAQYAGSANYVASPVSNTVTQVVNGLPTLGGVLGFVQMDELTPLTFAATVANPGSPTFSLLNGPAGAAIDGTGKFTWTPTEDQGPATYAFTVRVTDGPTIDDRPITVTVNEGNTAPVLAALPTGLTTVPGSTIAFAASATDTDKINAKNNTVTYSLTGNVPAGAIIDPDTGAFSWTPNEFNSLGTYTFNVRAADDGVPALSDSKSVTIALKRIAVVGGDLFIGGTAGNDTIAVAFAKKDASNLTVTMNKVLIATVPVASLAPIGKIVAHGLSGNDTISVSTKVGYPAWLFGEAGNDKLTGGGGVDVLVGGDGNDTLTDAWGGSVMIGGQGADKITSPIGRALMIGGSTDFDADLAGLVNIQAEWSSNNSDRIAHLNGTTPGGLNGTTFLTATTVHDDFVKDTLTGKKKGNGWFIVNALDKNDGTGLKDTVTTL